MPKVRTKKYKGGDRITLEIPREADPKLLRLLNTPKYVAPFIINILTEVAHNTFPDLKSADMTNMGKVNIISKE